MYWQETAPPEHLIVPNTAADLVFGIDCRALPLDHAHALSQAITAHLPWLSDTPHAGIHLIHGAESGNGWYRPEADAGDTLFYPSRRTKFELRLPKTRLEDARILSGKILDIDGHRMALGAAQIRPLSLLTTLFSRHVIADAEQSEEAFQSALAQALNANGVRFGKMLCGKTHILRTPERVLFTRSVMVAELTREHSIHLQEYGLGAGRLMGCGLFIPHKDVAPVRQAAE